MCRAMDPHIPAPMTLYYYPTSSNSQRVYMALTFKKLPFHKRLVFVHNGDVEQPWYLRINPRGLVPCLSVGGRTLVESEQIVDYLDTHFPGIQLVPDPSTDVGSKVKKWRKRIENIRFDLITFGTFMNPQLTPDSSRVPFVFRNAEALRKGVQGKLADLQRKAEDPSNEFRQTFLEKSDKLKERLVVILNPEKVSELYDSLEEFFDDVETELENTTKDEREVMPIAHLDLQTDGQTGSDANNSLELSAQEQGVTDAWLVTVRFTAADINLFILLDRLYMLGTLQRYLVPERRPHLCNYYNQLQTVPEVVLMRQEAAKMSRLMITDILKRKLPKVLSLVGLSVSVFVGIIYKLRTEDKII